MLIRPKQRDSSSKIKILLDRLLPLMRGLISEIKGCLDFLYESKSSDMARKVFIKTYVTFLETYSGCLLAICKDFHDNSLLSGLSNTEVKLLVNDQSKDVADRMKSSFKIAAKLCECAPPIDFSTAIWPDLISLINCRHRLTHPKMAKDLELNFEDWRKHMNAASLFYLELQKFDELVEEKLSKYQAEKNKGQPTIPGRLNKA